MTKIKIARIYIKKEKFEEVKKELIKLMFQKKENIIRMDWQDAEML